MLSCLSCNDKIALDAVTCPKCGTKVDADGNGIPDALERMVEDKARALLKSEKEREEAERERAARETKEKERATQLRMNAAELETLKQKRDEDLEVPRKAWAISQAATMVFAVMALVIGGIMLPACVEPVILGRSIASAKMFCSSVCPTCRAPGKIFTWHTTMDGTGSDESVQVCHNDDVDVDQIAWSDVSGHKYTKYELTMWSSVPLDFALVFLFLCLVGPFGVARLRNKLLENAREHRDGQIEMLEASLARTARPEATEPYR